MCNSYSSCGKPSLNDLSSLNNTITLPEGEQCSYEFDLRNNISKLRFLINFYNENSLAFLIVDRGY